MIEERIKHLTVALGMYNRATERHETAIAEAKTCKWRDTTPQGKRAKVSSERAKAALARLVPIRDGIEARLKWLLSQEEVR